MLLNQHIVTASWKHWSHQSQGYLHSLDMFLCQSPPSLKTQIAASIISPKTNIFSEQMLVGRLLTFLLTWSLFRWHVDMLIFDEVNSVTCHAKPLKKKLVCKNASFGDHVAETFPPGEMKWCHCVSRLLRPSMDWRLNLPIELLNR